MDINTNVPGPPRPIVVMEGGERFHSGEQPLDFAAIDFWRWSGSDLLANSQRGLVAEYLVARALDTWRTPRVEWDAVDLCTAEGLKVEVKCSGYLQSWALPRFSAIKFDVGQKRSWDASTNTRESVPRRCAHVYVFAVHAHKDRATANAMNVAQWEFYVVARTTLDEMLGSQASASLSTIQRLAGHASTYAELAARIRAAAVVE